MRIAVLGTSRAGSDPRTIRLVNTLASAGNQVFYLSVGEPGEAIGSATDVVVRVDTRWPRARGRIAGALRRANPPQVRDQIARHRLRTLLSAMSPDAVYATSREFGALADDLGLPVSVAGEDRSFLAHDIATLAPLDPSLCGEQGATLPGWLDKPSTSPSRGRHAGKRVVLCYHPTDTTPARYLHAALERAGVDVQHLYPVVNLDVLPDDVTGVVFVESPYPALEVTGDTSIPILFWVHHGEHHLYPNIRLAQRYRADAVLLAHSWHLGHRFATPTYRFPFGVPLELIGTRQPWDSRTIDVAMIAAGFDSSGARYAARRRIAQRFTARFGSERVLFTGGVTPGEMFEKYGKSKVVIDEGGALHRPITMRVFEATGSGSTLVTEPAPGLDLLFQRDFEYLELDQDDPVGSVRLDEDAADIAAAGRRRALGVHTYDHRVDELFEILRTTVKQQWIPSVTLEPVRSVVQSLAEIDAIACGATARAFDASSYVVWSHREIEARGIMVDAVIFGVGESPVEALLRLAHRFVICSEPLASTVRSMLAMADRSFTETTHGGVTVFDFETPGYIVREAM